MLKKRFILITVLVLSFVFSLVFYIGNTNRYTRLSFLFYHELTNEVVTEDRFVILKGSKDQKAQIIVKELFLGPMSVFNRKLTNFDLEYNHFNIREDVAYLDLPIEFILNYDDSRHTIEETVELIERNILKNINKINSVVFTVNGYLLNNGPFSDELPQGTSADKK